MISNPGHYLFRYFILILVFSAFQMTTRLEAQETHYWNLDYGTRANLLGGAVIGSVTDMSATFYNPGAVARLDAITVFQAGNVWFVNSININDGAGPGYDLGVLLFETAPSFYAGSLTFNREAKTRFAYSFLTRQRFKLRYYESVIDRRDVIARFEGPEDYSGEVVRQLDFVENWGGLTVSRQFGKRSSLGLTQYVVYRGQLFRTDVTSQAYPAGDPALTSVFKEVDYYSWRTLTKLGFYHIFKRYNFGISLTTPGLPLFGVGTVKVNKAVSLQDVDGDGTTDPEFYSNVQQDVKASYKTNWAVGIGFSREFEKSKIHLSAEWYAGRETYDVLDTQPFESQSGGELLPNEAAIKLESVLNVGFGVEHMLSKGLTGFFSITTDFSAAPSRPNKFDLVMTNWDIYHINFGGAFRIYRFDITAGLGLGYGTGTDEQLINFADLDERNQLLGTLGAAETRTIRMKFIIGLSYLID